jgi:hypothetical protein
LDAALTALTLKCVYLLDLSYFAPPFPPLFFKVRDAGGVDAMLVVVGRYSDCPDLFKLAYAVSAQC